MNNKILLFAALAIALAGAFIVIADSTDSDAATVTWTAEDLFDSPYSSFEYDAGTVVSISNVTGGSTEYVATPTSFTLSAGSSQSVTITMYIEDTPAGSETKTFTGRTITPTTYTVTIARNNTSYGSVSMSSVTVEAGTTWSASGNRLTIGSNTITATPHADTVQYDYSFSGWSSPSGTVTGNTTITANFSRSTQYYTVSFAASPSGYGSVSSSSVSVPYGAAISASGNRLTIGSYTVTATAASSDGTYNYSFSSWSGASGTVTGNKSITANFSRALIPTATYTATFNATPSGYGTVSDASLTVSQGDSWEIVGRDVQIKTGDSVVDVVTATAAASDGTYNYSFSSWTSSVGGTDGDFGGNVTFTATFTRSEIPATSYTATFTATPSGYGTVSDASLTVSQGDSWEIVGRDVQIKTGDSVVDVVTATPAVYDGTYEYAFESWTASTGGTDGDFEGDVAFTATFSRDYPSPGYVNWSNGQQNGSVSLMFKLPSSGTISHTMAMDLMQGTVTGTRTDWTDSGYDLNVSIVGHTVSATLTGNSASISKSVNIGTWSAFQVDLNVSDGNVKVTPVKLFNSFTDFTLYEKQTKTILDFSATVEGMSVGTIAHSSEGSAEARFSVVSTEVFLDTYGVILYNPSINLHDYFPAFEQIRANFFSFAIYGDSITINGLTHDVVGSKITVTYVSDGLNNYLPGVMPNETPKTRSFDLTNIYVTYDTVTGHVQLTFVDDRFTLDLGAFQPDDWTISMSGTWFFTMMVYEPYKATEKAVSGWKMLPETSGAQMILIFLGFLTLLTAAFAIHTGRKGLGAISLMIIAAAAIAAFVLLG